MADCLVLAEGLVKSYAARDGKSAAVLSGATCQVMAGDRIAVVGSSGSGKSTLLHILGGLVDPSTGRVTWPALGERTALQPTQISFVFQSPSLFPALTALRNVSLPLLLAGQTQGSDQRARAMLDLFGLADLAQKLPEELSGGQAQRIALARALVIRPRLILADEPTGQLDRATSAQVLQTLLTIAADQGTAVVMATHDPAMAAQMDHRWALSFGHLQSNAVTEEAA